ncbi:unnamed protein product [Schistocephalus solidus]|uniref:Ig-like domain-containing protein n=1 Tax=Schistocephalus solidus TaxID=70667 RepID=A0A183TD39_SCHSO|nr:unnamed protein product [Schistocephalus solidus]
MVDGVRASERGESSVNQTYALTSLAFEGYSRHEVMSEDEASTRDRSAMHPISSSERSTKYKPECFLSAVNGPCLLRPWLRDIPSQSVKQMFLNGSDLVVYLESVVNSVVYLPCGTQNELHNETVIWEHNFTTISVMGTLFTMDKRLDAASVYNEYRPCEAGALASSSTFTYYKLPPRGRSESKSEDAGVRMWELVVREVKQTDNGVYTCRLTGGAPQNIKYYLSVKVRSLPVQWPAMIRVPIAPAISDLFRLLSSRLCVDTGPGWESRTASEVDALKVYFDLFTCDSSSLRHPAVGPMAEFIKADDRTDRCVGKCNQPNAVSGRIKMKGAYE